MTTRRLLAEFDVATGPFNRNIGSVDRRLERFQTDFSRRADRFDARWEKTARSINRVQGALVLLGGSQVLRSFGELADASTRVDNRLAGIGETSDAARAKLFRLSVETRSNFEGNATVVQRFVKSTGDAFETNIRRVETLNKLFASAGTGQSERASTLTQFSQGLQSGVLQGEELKALRENAPIELLRALADEAGVAFEDLKKAGADGVLTLDVMTRAVDGLAATSDEAFGRVKATAGEGFGVLRTGLIEFIGNANDAAGVTDFIAEALINTGSLLGESAEAAEVLGQSLAVLGQVALSVAGGRGLNALNGAIGRNIAARKEAVVISQAEVVQARASVAAAEQRLVAAAIREKQIRSTTKSVAQLQKAEASTARARATLTSATNAQTAALTGLDAAQKRATFSIGGLARGIGGAAKGLLSLIGGPFGLALLAYTFLPDLIGGFQDAEGAVDAFSGSVDRLTRAQADLRGVEQDIAGKNNDLKTARERLNEAVAAGGEAARIAAAKEVQAISDTIGGLESLRQARLGELALARKRAEIEREEAFSKIRTDPRVTERVNKSARLAPINARIASITPSASEAISGTAGIFGTAVEAFSASEKAEIERLGKERAEIVSELRVAAIIDLQNDIVKAAQTAGEEISEADLQLAETILKFRTIDAQFDAINSAPDLQRPSAPASFTPASEPSRATASDPATQASAPTNTPVSTDNSAERRARDLAKILRERELAERKLAEAAALVGDFKSQERETDQDRLRIAENALKVENARAEAAAKAKADGFNAAEIKLISSAEADRVAFTQRRASAVNLLAERERSLSDAERSAEAERKANDEEAERRLDRQNKDRESLNARIAEIKQLTAVEQRRAAVAGEGEAAVAALSAELRAASTARDILTAATRNGLEVSAEEVSAIEAEALALERAREARNAAEKAAREDEKAKERSDGAREKLNASLEEIKAQTEAEASRASAILEGALATERLDAILRSEAEARALVNAAQREGLALSEQEIAKIYEATRARADSVQSNKEQAENQKASQEAFKSASDEAKDFAVALANAEDEGEVLRAKIVEIATNLLEIASKRLFESAFSANGADTPGTSGTSGGGLLGDIAGAIFGSFFADGGVMTSQGSMPLKTYSRGGIANSPQVAVYGEGRTPEAYVPLPDGRSIPVSLQMPEFPSAPRMPSARASNNNAPITVQQGNITIQGNADQSALRELRKMQQRQTDATIAEIDKRRLQGIA